MRLMTRRTHGERPGRHATPERHAGPTLPQSRPDTARTARMNKVKQIFGGDTRQLGMIFALVALIIFFQISTGGLTLTPDNVINIFQQQLLHPGPRHRHGARHHRRPHRPLGRLGRGVRRHRRRHRDARLGPPLVGRHPARAGARRRSSVPGRASGWPTSASPPSSSRSSGMLLFRGANQFVGKSNTVPVPDDFQVIGAGYLPEVGPDTGYNNLTVLLGLLACRRDHPRHAAQPPRARQASGPTSRTPGSPYTRIGLICVVVFGAMLLFASGRTGSFPVSGLILAVLVLLYGFIASKHRHRPAHLRRRRQPPRRRAVRREAASGSTSSS